MKIDEVLKKSEKATRPEWHTAQYVFSRDNHFFMCNVLGEKEHEYSSVALVDNNWIPYPEVNEISPKQAGEVWKFCMNSLPHYITEDSRGELYLTWKDGKKTKVVGNVTPVVHDNGYWTRLDHPVPYDSVDRIEIDDIIDALHANIQFFNESGVRSNDIYLDLIRRTIEKK